MQRGSQRGNPRIDFRVTPQEKERIQRCAQWQRQSPAEFARSVVLEAVSRQGQLPNSVEVQLLGLNEQVEEMRKLLKAVDARGSQIERLAAAAIASSAFAAYAEMDDEAFQSSMVAHVRAALQGSVQVLRQSKSVEPQAAVGEAS